MRLRQRVTLVFAVLIVAVAVVGLLLIADLRAQHAAQVRLDTIVTPAVEAGRALVISQAELSNALVAGDRTTLQRAAQRSTERAADLATLLLDDPLHSDAASIAHTITVVQVPAVTAVIGGAPPTDLSQTTAELLRSSEALLAELSARRDSAVIELQRLGRDAAVMLVAGLLALIGAWLAVLALLRRVVLAPIDRLRRNVRSVAVDRDRPISVAGPPDIIELAQDTEEMRRELVTQIDAANAARASMAQDAPLVTSIESAMASHGASTPWLACHGSTRAPHGVIAGDWWNLIPRPDGTVGVVIADVSGHGLEAGIAALRVRAVTDVALAEGRSPAATLAAAQLAITSPRHCVTAFVAVLDPNGVLTWANAGHPSPLIVTTSGRITECAPTGPLLTPLPSTWTDEVMRFAEGDVLFACTDGLVESLDADGEELTLEEVGAWLSAEPASVRARPSELAARILARARHRARDLADDVTLVCLARVPMREGEIGM